MLTARSQLRFLLRGSALIVAILALWWVVLKEPMLWALRGAATVSLKLISSNGPAEPVTLDAAGDWVFRIALAGGASGTLQINFIEFTIPEPDIVLFTLSVPLLWAVLLSVPATRRTIRPMLVGTAIAGCLEVLLLVVFVEVSGHSFVTEGRPAATGVVAWLRDLTKYLVTNVAPYVAPVLIALAVYPELRSRIFPAESQARQEPATAAVQAATPSRKAARQAKRLSRGR